jgi:NAD(P)-dependent dehydrogenase (short-subunit alcohol dehydrogenase family)
MHYKFSLAGRHALVTGGNQGIGLALATGLAQAGANVVIFDISLPSTEFKSISTKYDVRTAYHVVNVSSVAALKQGFEQTVKPFCGDSGLDICMAAAGINHLRDFLETEEKDFDRLMNVNVKGVYFTCQLAAQAMCKPDYSGEDETVGNGSKSIITISSTAAYVATRTHNSSAYAVTKSAVRGMVPELAKELGPHGIRINSLSPGYTLTNMTKGYPELVKQWETDTMLGIIGAPEDYVGAAVYLASRASRYVTGQDFLVDGGMTKW